MKIVALEFSSSRRSVAVLEAFGRDELHESQSPGDGTGTRRARPSEVLAEQAEAAGQDVPPLRLVERALAEAKVERGQIECVAVGLGPGSYTGIRGAIALAQGWQLAKGVKLVGISSVECIASQAQAEQLFGAVGVVVYAQRGEYYIEKYEISQKSIKITYKLNIISLTELKKDQKSCNFVIGPEEECEFKVGRVIFPGAAVLGRLAAAKTDFIPGEKLEPVYLREASFIKSPPSRFFPPA